MTILFSGEATPRDESQQAIEFPLEPTVPDLYYQSDTLLAQLLPTLMETAVTMARTNESQPHVAGIVEDGWSRLLAGIHEEVLPEIQQTVKQTVEEEFARQLADAGWFARIRIRRQMRVEVARRIREEISRLTPSDDALF